MNLIEKYYNKFNEDKRLESKHGIVEFTISMEYIEKYLNKLKNNLINNSFPYNQRDVIEENILNNSINNSNINLQKNINNSNNYNLKILDVGAGTGKYSIALSQMGYNITAVELVKKNLSVLKQNAPHIPAFQGNALNLKKFKDESFDAVILFGPMYHLFGKENKIKALEEAKRVTKKGGIIFVAHILASYAILKHGFMDKNIMQSMAIGKVDESFNLKTTEEDLYSYTTLKEIEELNKAINLSRVEIISPDGPTDYIRSFINNLSPDEFELYINFVRKNSSNPHTIGASSHVVDILKV